MSRRHKKQPKETSVETKPAVALPVVRTTGTISPADAYNLALSEPDRDLMEFLSQYCDTIHLLRERGFSYREIAEWLGDKGVPVDHNAVYRVYRKWAEQGGGMLAAEVHRDNAEG